MSPAPTRDLLARTAELIDIPSPSFQEAEITDRIEAELRALPGLDVHRIGDNVIARTSLDRPYRVVLAGHTDTVPPNDNERARIEGDTLWGLGASDMKGGLAVMLELARAVPEAAVDVTYVFYAREEVASVHSGLAEVSAVRADLLHGDVALLGEPTAGIIEAGCQGTMRFEVVLRGERAHTARPWMGRNAIHRLGRLLALVDEYEARRPVIDGCEYREALQAVTVEGGVANNVVPDRAVVRINHRVAPDRTCAQAEVHVRQLLAPVLDDGDELTVVEAADGAVPGLHHPLLRALIERNRLPVEAKLGWTDVARFSALGVPACNLGPGDATIAHMAGERVTRDQLERTYAALADLLSRGA